MLTFTLTTPLVLIVALAVVFALGIRARLDVGHFAAIVIFTIYLVGVANFVILPLRGDPALAQAVGAPDIGRLLELTPFFLPSGDALSREQLFLNVLLTVPFGFGLPFVVSLPLRTVVAIGVLFSVATELAQMLADVSQLAMPTWSIDINDVILNSLGVVVGVLAFVSASAAYGAFAGQLPVDRLGPWRHFHKTLVDRRSRRNRGDAAHCAAERNPRGTQIRGSISPPSDHG